MTPCQFKVINCTYFAVFAVSLRPFQGLIHADMDFRYQSKGTAITLFFNLNLVRKHEIAFD